MIEDLEPLDARLLPDSRGESREWYRQTLNAADKEGANALRATMRYLIKNDLYYLLTRVLHRDDIRNDWLFDRCREVQRDPNNVLNLWAREHRKSTIITFGQTIQDILVDPEITFGIFSITRPLAKDFLEQIRSELQSNEELKELFPDVLYKNPESESPTWNLDDGIIVRRKSNPRENTVEAYGLVNALPTGKHYQIRLYDDIIDQNNVTSPDILKKAANQWRLSLNLGSNRNVPRYGICDIARYAGTRYRFNDVYSEMIKGHHVRVRLHPATDNGKPNGKPVYFSEELFKKRWNAMGPYIGSCQLLLDPVADEAQGFKDEWLEGRWHVQEDKIRNMNVYIVVDPANEKKQDSDFTAMWVLGLNVDNCYYLIDGVRDRLNLVERQQQLFRLHRLYHPIVVGYERYGLQADIAHMKVMMEQENYHFQIRELGGQVPKNDRIRWLIPPMSSQRFFFPHLIPYKTREGKMVDLTNYLIEEELKPFPAASYRDGADALARIMDKNLGASFPKAIAKPIPGAHLLGVNQAELQNSVRARRLWRYRR